MRQKLLSFLFLASFIWLSRASETDLVALSNDQNWELIHNFDDSIKVYRKHIAHRDLNAYRVLKNTNAAAPILYRVFENIENYDQVIKSAKNIDFAALEVEGDTIYGYQNIQINVPFIKNRHYVYQMVKHNPNTDYAYWVLVDQSNGFEDFISKKYESTGKPLYLSQGTGVYKVNPNRAGTQRVSYSLYMDPGGNLPNFLINMINERGLVNLFRDVLKEAEKIDKQGELYAQ